jgi:hypothetical protein
MFRRYAVALGLLLLIPLITAAARDGRRPSSGVDAVITRHADDMVNEGRQTFRFDTFGDEEFWGGTLGLHRAIAGARLGGIGPGVSPRTALAVGLKVDADALPQPVIASLAQGRVDVDDPAVTVALLRLNAVVGVTGLFDEGGRLQSMGIQCALWPPASAGVWTGGLTAISTWARSWRWRPIFSPSPTFSASAMRPSARS